MKYLLENHITRLFNQLVKFVLREDIISVTESRFV